MAIIRRIGNRLKKYLGWVIAVPVLLGALGGFLPVGGDLSRFQASATILLGSYGDPQFNEPENVQILLTNQPFYQKNFPHWTADQINALPASLNVTVLKKKMIQIAYTSSSRDEAAEHTNRIASRFIREDHRAFNQKKQILTASIDRLEKVRDSSAAGDTARMLYRLQSEQLREMPAQILQRAVPGSAHGSAAFSSKKRAILGIVLGLTLIFFAAAWPEFVSESAVRKDGGKA
ncbi:MAG: hypothetical protein ABF651_09645 [Sporolactobacillus sp.]